ncbi:outer membrane protein transport protein [Jannaschia sp. W003]|uniref:outer membrane protein transport protein n=1 Tax=Jannaschia sp. W003 TaxID=2867012 RepID=UPI0021A85318|nr:outer membrane protein transport protein [Jannaschia sp. W003]UWQ20545.1 outer membrane protein transport protein [Jannaschia sp. W003]
MIRIATALLATTAIATGAQAGGLDRSQQSVLSIFDPEDTVSLTFNYVMPDVTGTDFGAGRGSYDVGENYSSTQLSFTNRLNERVTYSVIADQPFGADIDYDFDPRTSNLGGTAADLSAEALSFIARMEVNENVSVFGGVRAQRAGGTVKLNGQAYAAALGARAAARPLGTAVGTAAATPGAPNQAAAQAILGALGDGAGTAFAGVATGDPRAAALGGQLTAAGFGADVATAQGTFGAIAGPTGAFVAGGGYSVDIEDSWGAGLTLGAAYEIPEIALRLAVTYHSEVVHDGNSVERFGFIGGGAPIVGETSFSTPQSINVDFQTGINEQTLLIAGLRWADWDDFDVIPPNLGTDLADIDDVYRVSLGVARRFTPDFVGLATVTYEEDNGSSTVSPLGPNDGQIGLSLGGRYSTANMNVSGGLNYTKLGDADAGVAGRPVAAFRDNDALGVGLRLTYEF